MKLRAIGDTVLTLPSLQALREAYPQSQITMLVPEHSQQLLEGDPRIDALLSYSRERLGVWKLQENAIFFKELQSRNFDLAIALHASFRSALLVWASGAEARIARNHSGRDWFSNIAVPEVKEPKSIIQRDFDVLRALGLNPKQERPKLFLSLRARREAQGIAKREKMKLGRGILLFPFAGKREKEWPLENFQELKRRLEKLIAKRRSGHKLFWLAAPGQEAPPGALQIAELQTLGAFSSLAGYCIGNDSGPRHIAAASGAKTLTLFGPEATREWHPYLPGEGQVALSSPRKRIDELSIEAVLQAAQELLWP
jgi:ADP-heptose:LPS heptosyltransferase